MTTPDTRLTHTSPVVVSLARNRLVKVTRISHHADEPRNTPSTTFSAPSVLPAAASAPTPAKMAAKAKIVSGLVSVRNSAELYAPSKPRPRAAAAPSYPACCAGYDGAGGERNVLTPR